MIELEVERPRPLPSSGISYIYEFSSFYSHEFVVYFISLGSIEPLKSFNSLFFLFIFLFFYFLPNFKNLKFDLFGSLQKMRSLIALPGYIDSSKKRPKKYDDKERSH